MEQSQFQNNLPVTENTCNLILNDHCLPAHNTFLIFILRAAYLNSVTTFLWTSAPFLVALVSEPYIRPLSHCSWWGADPTKKFQSKIWLYAGIDQSERLKLATWLILLFNHKELTHGEVPEWIGAHIWIFSKQKESYLVLSGFKPWLPAWKASALSIALCLLGRLPYFNKDPWDCL